MLTVLTVLTQTRGFCFWATGVEDYSHPYGPGGAFDSRPGFQTGVSPKALPVAS
jgi:hypothetical protein